MIIKKFFLAAFLLSIMGFGGLAEAQTTTSVLQKPTAQKLAALQVQVQSAQMELIKQLIAQVTALQEQLTKLLAAQPPVPATSVGKIVVDLKINGSDGPLVLRPGYAKFTWKTNAEYCVASGDVDHWSGKKAASGEARVWAANEKYGITTYTLECGGTNVNSEGDSVKITFDYGTQPSQKPTITNVKSKAASDWEIRAGDTAGIQGFNLGGVTAVLFNCCKPDYEIKPTSVSDTNVTFNVPADYVGKDVVQLSVTGRDGSSDYRRVTVLIPDDSEPSPISMLELTSPNGGETYSTDIPEINIKYRSKGLKGEEVIAYLHKSDKHYSSYQRSKTVMVSSDSGNILMGMQKGGPEEPGKYKITICALIPGKDFCRTSRAFELVGEIGEPYVTDSFKTTSGAGTAEYSYDIHNLRDGMTFWAEPEVYCDDKYIAPINRDCSKSTIFFAWSEGGVKGDGGKMNPYVKGGASYQLPTSLNESFITTSGVAHEFAPNPDWIDINFVLRDERGLEVWSKSHRLQFKG